MNHKFRGIFKMPFSLGVLAAMLFFTGCLTQEHNFALVSTIDNPVTTASKSSVRISGEACHSGYLVFIFSAKVDEVGAVQEATKKANQLGYPANALANVEINYRYFKIPFIVETICTIAEGNPVNIEAY